MKKAYCLIPMLLLSLWTNGQTKTDLISSLESYINKMITWDHCGILEENMLTFDEARDIYITIKTYQQGAAPGMPLNWDDTTKILSLFSEASRNFVHNISYNPSIYSLKGFQITDIYYELDKQPDNFMPEELSVSSFNAVFRLKDLATNTSKIYTLDNCIFAHPDHYIPGRIKASDYEGEEELSEVFQSFRNDDYGYDAHAITNTYDRRVRRADSLYYTSEYNGQEIKLLVKNEEYEEENMPSETRVYIFKDGQWANVSYIFDTQIPYPATFNMGDHFITLFNDKTNAFKAVILDKNTLPVDIISFRRI